MRNAPTESNGFGLYIYTHLFIYLFIAFQALQDDYEIDYEMKQNKISADELGG